MHLHEAVGEQHDRHVDASQQRIGRPAQHAHQPAGPCPRTRGRVTGRSKILTVVEHDGDPFPLLGRVDEVAFEQGIDRGDRLVSVAWPVGGVAHPFGEPLHHRPQTGSIGAGERPETLPHVVAEHDVPAAEEFAGQKIRCGAPAGRRLAVGGAERHEITDIAMYQEDATRAGEIRISEPFCPRRTPCRQGRRWAVDQGRAQLRGGQLRGGQLRGGQLRGGRLLCVRGNVCHGRRLPEWFRLSPTSASSARCPTPCRRPSRRRSPA